MRVAASLATVLIMAAAVGTSILLEELADHVDGLQHQDRFHDSRDAELRRQIAALEEEVESLEGKRS